MAEPPQLRRLDGGPLPAKKAARKAPAKKAAAKKAPRKVAAKRAVPPPPPPPEEPPPPVDDVSPDVNEVNPADNEVLHGEIVDPTWQAYLLKLQGKSWREVAAQTGFNDWQDARNSVNWFLNRAAAEQAKDRRAQAMELSIARHEALLSAYWAPATVMLDPQAAMVVSRELAALDKLQRLGEKDVDDASGTTVVVIAGNREEYLAQLQQAVHGEGRMLERRAPAAIPPPRNEVLEAS